MIITNNFVLLNFPKTGSSFVRTVIKKIYKNRMNKNKVNKFLTKYKIRHIGYEELYMEYPDLPNYKDQHGCYYQIPNKHKIKPILSVIRNPYSRLESLFRFKWWEKYPFIEAGWIRKYCPNFPELSFDEYLHMTNIITDETKIKYGINSNLKIGDQSIQFIRMFFKKPEEVFLRIDKSYIENKLFKNDLCDLTLLRQENLNQELIFYLMKHGFNKKEVEFIKNHEKVNVTNFNDSTSVSRDKIIEYINENEWILLEILSAFNINYQE